MMKGFLVITAILCTGLCANAQVQIGPKAGLSLSKISGLADVFEDIEYPFIIGFNVGVTSSIQITDNFSIAPELLYAQKGTKLRFEFTFFDGRQETTFPVTTSIRLNYLEMPVLGRIAFGNSI